MRQRLSEPIEPTGAEVSEEAIKPKNKIEVAEAIKKCSDSLEAQKRGLLRAKDPRKVKESIANLEKKFYSLSALYDQLKE